MPRPKKEKPTRADGIYEVKITLGRTVQGKLIRKSFYSSVSKADARSKAEEYKIKHEAANRTGVFDYNETMTFEKWAHKWLEVYKKPYVSDNTYLLTYKINVENHIIPYFGSSLLKNIRNIDIQSFFDDKCDKLSQSTLDKLHLCLFGIFDKAIDNDLIYKNPVKNIVYKSAVLKNTKNVWTDNQIETAKKYFSAHMPEVVLMLDTGLRRGETLALMWDDIDFTANTLSVKRSVADRNGGGVDIMPPKKESYRTIPIPQSLADLLQRLPHTSDYIFPNSSGSVQLPRSFSKRLANDMKKFHEQYTDIPILTAHELRHTRGTQLRRNGTDIYTIQKLMGHKDINVTANTYVHDDVETTRKSAKIF